MSLTNAGLLGQDQLLPHLIQDGPYNVQFLEVWPWFGISGKQLDIANTARFTTPTAQHLGSCDQLEENTRSPAELKSFSLSTIQTRYDICFSDIDNIEDPNDLIAEQDALAILSMLYEYARLLDTGSGTFPALHTLTDQIVDLAGAMPQLEDFNRTLLRVTNNNGFDVIVMGNLDALNTYWSQAYERGLNTSFFRESVPANMGGRTSVPQTFVQHARWYVNELIPTRTVEPAGVPATNVYFIQLGNNSDYGTAKGTFGIVPRKRVNNMFVRREHEGNFAAGSYATNKSVFWSFPSGVAVAGNRSVAVLQDMQINPI